MVLAALLLLLFAVTTVGIGATLRLYSGRNMALDSPVRQNSSGWIYLGPYLTIPATLILLAARRWRRTLVSGALLAVAVLSALVITVPRGDRTIIITLVLPLMTLPFLLRGRRPRMRSVLVVLLLSVLAINVLRLERNRGERTDPVATAITAITQPGPQLRAFITGPDPSLFSVLALEYEVVPRAVPYAPGITPATILTGPVPGKLWASKPLPGAVHVTRYLFYRQSLIARASFLPSTFGDMYADFGLVAVALYSLLIGAGLRVLYEYFVAHDDNVAVQLAFAASLPLIIIFVRNDLTDTLAHSVALVVPVMVCAWVCIRPRGTWLPRVRTGGWRRAR